MANRVEDGERVCFLHVGAPKTGTTAIQHFLVSNAAALAQAGARYPLAGRCTWRPGHHALVDQLRAETTPDPRVGMLASVMAETAGEGAARCIISAEDLVVTEPPALLILRDAFAAIGYRVKVVLYVRAHAEYVEAAYCEAVKHGSRVPFDRFVEAVIESGVVNHPGWRLPVEFSMVADRFAHIFGGDAMIVRGYRNEGGPASLVRDFLDAIGIDTTDGAAPFVWPTVYENQRLSTADVARLFGDMAAEPLSERDRAAGDMPFAPLTAEGRALIDERFAGDVVRLVDRWSVGPETFRPSEAEETDATSRARERFYAVSGVRRATKIVESSRSGSTV